MTEFITIATFNFTHEIMVLKSILDHEGILYLFQNENLIAVDPLATFAYGGILLKVHPNDIEKVKEILDNKLGENWYKLSDNRHVKFNRFLDINTFEFQSILGWYLSEGNINSCSVEITQVNEKYMKEFLDTYNFCLSLFPSVSLYTSINEKKRILFG
jgi:hypothetical protein